MTELDRVVEVLRTWGHGPSGSYKKIAPVTAPRAREIEPHRLALMVAYGVPLASLATEPRDVTAMRAARVLVRLLPNVHPHILRQLVQRIAPPFTDQQYAILLVRARNTTPRAPLSDRPLYKAPNNPNEKLHARCVWAQLRALAVTK